MKLRFNATLPRLVALIVVIVLVLTLVLTLVFTRKGRRRRHDVNTNPNPNPNTSTNTKPAFTTPEDVFHTQAWHEGRAFIVGGVEGGGSRKFINDLQTHFPHMQSVSTQKQLRGLDCSPNDVVFLQHLWGDITVLDVLGVVQASHCRLYVNVHDWTYLLPMDAGPSRYAFVHNAYLLRSDALTVDPVVRALFADADLVLHPSKFTSREFSRVFDASNFLITPHIDELVRTRADHFIPPIRKSVINIGVLHQPSEYKGTELIQALQKAVRTHRGFAVAFKVVGVNIPAYEDTQADFTACLARHNIHGVTLLNKWGETYCYALTKLLNSGLPVLYNNFGAVKERMPAKGPYFKLFDTEAEFQATAEVAAHPSVSLFLDYILAHAQHKGATPHTPTVPAPAVVPPFYTFVLRDDVHVTETWKNMHARVRPYCFYNLSDPSADDGEIRQHVATAAHWGMCGFCLRPRDYGDGGDGGGVFPLPFFASPVALDFKVFFSLDLPRMLFDKKWKERATAKAWATHFKHVNYLKVRGQPVVHVQTTAGPRRIKKQTAKEKRAEVEFAAALHAACIDHGFSGLVIIGDFLESALYVPGVIYLALNDSKAVTNKTIAGFARAPEGKADDDAKDEDEDGGNDERKGIRDMLLIESWNDWENGTSGQPNDKMGHARLKNLKLALTRVL